MIRQTVAALVLSASGVVAQSSAPHPTFDAFEVATIKLVNSDAVSGVSGRLYCRPQTAPGTNIGDGAVA